MPLRFCFRGATVEKVGFGVRIDWWGVNQCQAKNPFTISSFLPARTTMTSRSTPLLFFLIALSLVSYIQAGSWGVVSADKLPTKQSFGTTELQKNAKSVLQNASADLQQQAAAAKKKAESIAKEKLAQARKVAEAESKKLSDRAREARDKATEQARQMQADAKKSANDMTKKAQEQGDKLLADAKSKADDILKEAQKRSEQLHAQANKVLQNLSTATTQ
jgi:hypothetical protein